MATVVNAAARERILSTAYALFSRRGIRDVGVNEIIRDSGASKGAFYYSFPSKDDLVLAFLARREEVWTLGYIIAQSKHRGSTPADRLLGIFDVFSEWFRREDFDACSFINVLLEMGPEHPLGVASAGYLENIRGQIRLLAEDANIKDPAEFARSWHILMKGSIVSAMEGDVFAAQRAKEMGRWLIDFYTHEAP